MKISVNVPSYKRPDKIITLNYLPYAQVWVDGSEYEAYKKANPKAKIRKCADGIQGNLCRVLNHILDEEFKRGMDVVLILDDNRFAYQVTDREELPGTAVEDMSAGNWDLTLFTCTYGGQNRITIRCEACN